MKRTSLLSTVISSALLALAAGAIPVHAKTFVYVSNAEDGDIDGYSMNEDSGELRSLGKTAAGKLVMPMAVSPDKHHLYAIVRSLPLSVVTYEINPSTGALVNKAKAPLPDSMAYASTDAGGRFLFTASYGGDKIAVSPIEGSGLIEKPAFQVIPTGHNAHSIRSDLSNKFVFATNLGSSQILQFRFDANSGALSANDPSLVTAQPGNGPRHIVFSPDNRFMYVLNELTGNVAQFALDQKKGTLSELSYTGSVSADSGLLPGLTREAMAVTASSGANTKAEGDAQPRIWAADIHITPNGRFMYASERTSSKIALMSIDAASGKPTYVTNFPTETQPRGIRLDPMGRFLVAAGEKSDRISVYKIDQSNGGLTLVGRFPVGHDANWVEIVQIP